jgi:hypothetical protein
VLFLVLNMQDEIGSVRQSDLTNTD